MLDLARPEVSAYLLDCLDALVREYRLDYLKWDHNRDLLEAVHARTGQAGVHRQTLAVYALLDALRQRHPALEIESCSSGGGRVDLGVLEHTDRVWASDTNDPLERQLIQRWTTLLLPPELVGSHVGGATAHTTARVTDLHTRCLTSLFAHAGIEWDITSASAGELDQLAAWTRTYRELRPLLHSGDVVRADLPDPGALLHGVVAADRTEAVFAYVRLTTVPEARPGRVRLPGLDPARHYQVAVRTDFGSALTGDIHPPAWCATGVTARGSVLAAAGLEMPALHPGHGLLLHVRPA